MRTYYWIIGLLIAALLGAIAYSAVFASPEIVAGLLVAAATALISVFSVILGKRLEKEREIEQEQRINKAEIYQEFMQFWMKTIEQHKVGEVKTEDVREFFQTFTHKALIWGSEDVIIQFGKFREMSAEPPDEPLDLMLELEVLIAAMRADLGYSNKGLHQGDLLTLFINDIRRQIEVRRKSKESDE